MKTQKIMKKAFDAAKKKGAYTREDYVYKAAIELDKLSINIAECGPLAKEKWFEYLDNYATN